MVLLYLILTYTASGQDVVIRDTLPNSSIVEKGNRIRTIANSAPTAVMEKEEMEMLGLNSLSEAVKRFAGVSVKDYGGIGGMKTVSVRSLGSQHTGVNYDGVAVSNAQSGQVDISRFSLDNIQQISLSIGQSEDIFQPAKAFISAGTLSIMTADPAFADKDYNINLRILSGSFGEVNPNIRYEQKISDKLSSSLIFDYLRADGVYPFKLVNGTVTTKEYRNNSDIQSCRGETNLYCNLGAGGKLKIKGYWFDSERGLPGVVILYNRKASERLWDKIATAQASYENVLSEKWTMRAQLKYSFNWNKYIDKGEKYAGGMIEDRYLQREYYGSASVRFAPSANLTFTFAQDIVRNTLHSNIPENREPTRISYYSVLAGKYATSRLTAVASLLGMVTDESVKISSAAPDRKRITPSLSLSYKLSMEKDIRIRASYRAGYRIPTFNDLYYQRLGNINLEPEKADQFNIGISRGGKLIFNDSYSEVSLDCYYNKVSNKIVAIPTMFIWKMLNVGAVDILGADVSFTWRIPLSEGIELRSSLIYSYQHAVDVTDPDSNTYNDQIAYTPIHSGDFSLSCINKWINISYSITASGKRWALPQNNDDNKIDPYADHNLSVNKTLKFKKFKLKVRGELLNLTNVNYEIINYYPMPGRSFRIAVEFIL